MSTDFTPTSGRRRPTQRAGPSTDQRVLRDVAAAITPPPSTADLRICQVLARDTATLSVTVDLGGDTGNPVSLVKVANPAYYPRINDLAIVVQQRSDLYTIGSINGKIGHARVRAASHADIAPSTITPIAFTTQISDTDNIWSAGTPTRLTFPWPGVWLINGNIGGVGGATAGVRRLASIRLNGGTYIDRQELSAINPPDAQHHKLSGGRVFAAGDWIEATFFQGGSGNLALEVGDEYAAFLDVTWKGPG
jgi:hypothetical protein